MEYFDIYDRSKKKTGLVSQRKGYFLNDNQYALIVVGLVERSDHRFLITRRTLEKKWAGGWWEAAGGGVMAGETSLEAICRELREETGLDVTKAPGGCIYTYSRENPEEGDNYFVDIFHFRMDFEPEDVKVDPKEVIDFRLATLDDIAKLNDEGIFLHYDRIMEALEQEQKLGIDHGVIVRIN